MAGLSIAGAIVLLAAGLLLYALKVEPYRLTVNEHRLNEPFEGSEELRIVQLSDIHIKPEYTVRQLKRIVDKANELAPDLIVFTGDLYDRYNAYRDDENVVRELRRLKARYGKIAIWGNHDCAGGEVKGYRDVIEGSGFTLLQGENCYLYTDLGHAVMVTGIDDYLGGKPYMPDESKSSPWDFQILLVHEPDVVDQYVDYDYDIVLAGHTHGGQVRLPFMKPPVTTKLGKTYTNGIYTIKGRTATQALHVNTGLGTSRFTIRFCVVPEIALLRAYL
ncbi:metallophosphoesterase [Eggerthella lenta]|uniref:metallophosphoesterase n=1 Tax=Eggerthella lenta TaxID=84112 RepID=UPI001FB901D2|nr:metallophosphoesterase [Eggerthella lenta]GKG83051.1 phosphohydrolase [Eggerthella lenta]GKG86158.1 phosphohydrolase [Eggerthella lenta]